MLPGGSPHLASDDPCSSNALLPSISFLAANCCDPHAISGFVGISGSSSRLLRLRLYGKAKGRPCRKSGQVSDALDCAFVEFPGYINGFCQSKFSEGCSPRPPLLRLLFLAHLQHQCYVSFANRIDRSETKAGRMSCRDLRFLLHDTRFSEVSNVIQLSFPPYQPPQWENVSNSMLCPNHFRVTT